MLVRRYVGSRFGVSRRLTSDCSRSASPMITCVYSDKLRRGRARASSSCAAPRMPPSGFLISCARLRIRSRFACCCSSRRSSRAIFSCWSMWRNSISSAASCGVDGRHRAREVQLALAADAELDLLLGVRRAAHRGLGDARRRAPGHSPKISRGVCADELLPRQLEQVFGGGIHVGHALVGAQHQHRGREQIQTRIAGDAGRGRRKERSEASRRRSRSARDSHANSCAHLAIRRRLKSPRRSLALTRRARALS